MGYEDLGAPQSRNERYLMNMLGATYEVGEPQSRIEYLLKEILENGGGGGGSGDVSGVKGALEDTYRTGRVNLSLPNITNVSNGLEYDVTNKVIKGVQFSEMPTPAAIWLGKIIQYTGETTTTAPIYKTGHFYKCIQSGSTQIWDDCLGDETEELTQEQMNTLLALLD